MMSLMDMLFETQIIPDMIIVDGVKRHTKNSNGELIGDTELKIRNFYRWFGESKMVDSSGKPLVVYHGTSAIFNTFKLSTFGTKMGDGIYFTSFKSDAIKYSKRVGGGRVIAVYLKCEKLAEIENPFKKSSISTSYDSIIAARGEPGGEEILVKSPNQIKAVDNNGKFGNSDDIYR